MADHRIYELTEEQHAKLLNASEPTPAMFLSGGQPMCGTPEENAEREWQRLGEQLKFKWSTARSVPGKSDYFFSAEPTHA